MAAARGQIHRLVDQVIEQLEQLELLTSSANGNAPFVRFEQLDEAEIVGTAKDAITRLQIWAPEAGDSISYEELSHAFKQLNLPILSAITAIKAQGHTDPDSPKRYVGSQKSFN